MTRQEFSIKRKLVGAMLLTSLTVLVLTVVAFTITNLANYRAFLVRSMSTLALETADQSSAALAFQQPRDADEILSALRAEPQVAAAAIYDAEGKIFVTYHNPNLTASVPAAAGPLGHRFEDGHLFVVEPVTQNGTRLGTLCVVADLTFFYSQLETYGVLSALILLVSGLLALVLSNRLQQRVSEPILALAAVARSVSEKRDYSVRATKLSADELGLLTDAFNQMLGRIEEQTGALQQSEERLRLALSGSRTGTWDWDAPSGKIIWDDFANSLLGLRPGQFDGAYKHFLKLVPAADRHAVNQAVRRTLRQQLELSAEFPVVWPDGSLHDMAARGKASFDSSGKAVRMSGVTQDITERRRSEAAQRRLAAIVESSDDAIIGKDLAGRIISWNHGAEQLFGFTAAEAVGQSILIIVPPELKREELDLIERTRRGEAIVRFETVRRRKDGTRLQVALTLSPIRDEKGRTIGVSKIARDISEAKRAQDALERQARILREQAQMLDLANVMARDMDSRIILWNTGMEKMYGWLRGEMLGRIAHEALRSEFPVPVQEIIARLLRRGQWEGELAHTRKDGKRLTVATQWVLHRDPEGRPAAILEVHTDITGRKEAEQQVMRMNTELERRVAERTAELSSANRELEAFTYSVAHDLRAPLRHIDAFSRIVSEDYAEQLPSEARRYLDIIRKGSQNMARLVDDLLNLARVGRQELQRQPVALKPLVQEVIEDLSGESEGRRIEWHVDSLPTAEGDPGLLKQVFANLLSNAVKYTRPRPQAVIEIGQQQDHGETVVFVRDNGVGFNMKFADKLFGVFQRLHRADEFEGTGVGLAIVDRVLRRHGGRVWAEAEVNRGATFYFTLPGLDKRLGAD